MIRKNKKVAVLLSGGVDSSVAAALLVREGYDVTAFYLKIWLEDDFQFLGECPFEEDLKYAKLVADRLKIELKVVPLQNEYWAQVVSYAVSELRLGATPSPDLLCNQKIKFGAFVQKFAGDFDFIASGHYAQLFRESNGIIRLARSPDLVKDQTYFLSQMSAEQLEKCLFPLGPFTKYQVRKLAEELELPNANRPDSQGICFLGKIKFRDFVAAHLHEKTGEVIDKGTGRILGNHQGYWFHTIGQRKGLGLSGGPWFVVDKDVDNNIIYVSHEDTYQENARIQFYLPKMHWIDPSIKYEKNLEVKLRHGPHLQECTLEGVDLLTCILEHGDSGLATGQFAVFYRKGEPTCLGSGRISLTKPIEN